MRKRWVAWAVAMVFIALAAGNALAGEVEILGVKFPVETVIEGKTLKLNGVSFLKRLAFVNVYAVGLYLESPSQDPQEVIESEQVKYLLTHYLTSRATAEKIREAFIELMEANNPPEMVAANRADIEKYASWLDTDMAPGLVSESIYVPGQGLTLIYQGQVKGTIPGSTFAQMVYRYNVGQKAEKHLREGLLGL